MEDLIARLYPFEDTTGKARKVIKDPVNSPEDCPRCVDMTRQSPELQGRQSRETTAPPDDDNDEKPQPQDRDPGLELRFSHKLKGGLGIVFGTNRNSCDIVLPHLSGISRRHCYITFDDQRRLIVRDASSYGTIVTYDKKGRERRSNFKWIIGGHQVPDETKTIAIEIHPELKFQIVVSKYHPYPDLFFSNVGQFLREIATNNELPFSALGLDSAISTAALSGRDTPNDRPILLKRGKLGEGTFGVVHRVWDVSTGFEYASKKFRNAEKLGWTKEASIMAKISHDHVTSLIATIERPSPRLILEFLPLGNLEDQNRERKISNDEAVVILHQSLSALTYLHSQTPPIVHRDIKPENILVLARNPFHIKLADFGFAKAANSLQTFCGTETYFAPEIAKCCGSIAPEETYTMAVDIWSLGVVILRFTYGLPHPGKGIGADWCEKIIDKANDYEGDLSDFLSTAMLVMEPKSRYSARACLDRAKGLCIPFRLGSVTPTPVSYADETGAFMESPLRPSEIREYIKSNIQDPYSHRSTSTETRKRSCRALKSSSPARRPPKRLTAKASPINNLHHEHSETGLDLFAEGWLQDSKCVGSSIAALGKEESFDCGSSWATKTSKNCPSRSEPEPKIAERTSYNSEWNISEWREATGGLPAQSFGFQRGGSPLTVPQSMQGSPYLRPFRQSETLERHSIQNLEDGQSSLSPKMVEKDQPLRTPQEATVGPMTQLRDVQENLDLSLVRHSWNAGTLTDTAIRADKREMQDALIRSNECSGDLDQSHIVGPAIAREVKQPTIQAEVQNGTHPAATPPQKKKKEQGRTEREFLTVPTPYGAIHLLMNGSKLLANATNIANIFGHDRILPHRDRPSPVVRIIREFDPHLHGCYCTIEEVLQYCDLLGAQTNVAQKNRRVGHILKEQLQRAIQDPGKIQPFIKPSYRKRGQPRCQRCARLHYTCSREVPCQNCRKALQECLYDSRP